ncbi:uncharacterized protein LOC122527500 [Frieseomelitta varia]|uniref:uncharacterized protein LOC122527500 n=1 Tax=Frieseomelitta varia TaxID=561572 RepID=UPI001CB686EC|nr:uncharacterized protein LOC122527500 [Frieseomelitta varia]
MALKRCLLSIIVITISIAVSPIFTWDPDNHRYESYDLEKGPVFYEAYYPDANEEPRSNYQKKRYFDQGTILEKTYQVPTEHLAYPENNIQLDNYQNRADTGIRNDNRFFFETNARPLDVKEISKLARRAITRDLENWNTLENYLDHVKYQDLVYRRRYVIPEPGYRVEQPIRGQESNLPDPLNERRDLRRDLYEEVREEPLALPSRVESNGGQRDSLRRLTVRDLTNRDSLGSFRSIRYENQSPRERDDVIQAVRTSQINMPSMRNTDPSSSDPIVDPYPTENIFAPRPQVINYIFSRKPEIKENAENKVQSLPETKETGERMPRNYGDNLIRDEMRKTTEEDKDVKVTSIEVSEVPRHKTRHHHGEWPKRDYSRRRQS